MKALPSLMKLRMASRWPFSVKAFWTWVVLLKTMASYFLSPSTVNSSVSKVKVGSNAPVFAPIARRALMPVGMEPCRKPLGLE